MTAIGTADFVAIAGDGAVADEAFGAVTIDVPTDRWAAAAAALRDDTRSAHRFFDWLSAYDDLDAGLAVVARLWSVTARHAVILRTHVERDGGRVATLTGLWPGADWHERETWEMFGIDFDGHPDLRPLLLPNDFEGRPLRKDIVLASRVARPWPGRKEPGESDADLATGAGRSRRRQLRPPGVPEPDDWGTQS
jgi:NADH-quinone oxidoreductase subunit C